MEQSTIYLQDSHYYEVGWNYFHIEVPWFVRVKSLRSQWAGRYSSRIAPVPEGSHHQHYLSMEWLIFQFWSGKANFFHQLTAHTSSLLFCDYNPLFASATLGWWEFFVSRVGVAGRSARAPTSPSSKLKSWRRDKREMQILFERMRLCVWRWWFWYWYRACVLCGWVALFIYTHGHHLHAQPLISQRRAFIGAGLFALKNKRRFLQQPNILLYWKLRDWTHGKMGGKKSKLKNRTVLFLYISNYCWIWSVQKNQKNF